MESHGQSEEMENWFWQIFCALFWKRIRAFYEQRTAANALYSEEDDDCKNRIGAKSSKLVYLCEKGQYFGRPLRLHHIIPEDAKINNVMESIVSQQNIHISNVCKYGEILVGRQVILASDCNS